jgi:hypothetical protein
MKSKDLNWALLRRCTSRLRCPQYVALTFNVRDHRLDSDTHVGIQQPGSGLPDIFLVAITLLVDHFSLGNGYSPFPRRPL